MAQPYGSCVRLFAIAHVNAAASSPKTTLHFAAKVALGTSGSARRYTHLAIPFTAIPYTTMAIPFTHMASVLSQTPTPFWLSQTRHPISTRARAAKVKR